MKFADAIPNSRSMEHIDLGGCGFDPDEEKAIALAALGSQDKDDPLHSHQNDKRNQGPTIVVNLE